MEFSQSILLAPDAETKAPAPALAAWATRWAETHGAGLSDLGSDEPSPGMRVHRWSLGDDLGLTLTDDRDDGRYATVNGGRDRGEGLLLDLRAAFPECAHEEARAIAGAREGRPGSVVRLALVAASASDEVANAAEDGILAGLASEDAALRGEAIVALGLFPTDAGLDAAFDAAEVESDAGLLRSLQTVLQMNGVEVPAASPAIWEQRLGLPDAASRYPGPEPMIVYRPTEIDPAVCDAFLPAGAAARERLFFVARRSSGTIKRLLAEVPEPPIDFVDEGLALAERVLRLAQAGGRLPDVIPVEKTDNFQVGFHSAPYAEARAWLEAHGVALRPIGDVLGPDERPAGERSKSRAGRPEVLAAVPAPTESILRGLAPAVAATSEREVARGLGAIHKGQGLADALQPHRDALVRMAWLVFVRTPSLNLSSFATVPMQLETIALSGEGLEALCEDVRLLEAEAAGPDSTLKGVELLRVPAALGERVVASSGEALEAMAREALTLLQRSGQLDVVIEAATAAVMANLEAGMEQGDFDDLVEGTAREKSDRWVERGQGRFRQQDVDGALDAFDRALEHDPDNLRALLYRAEILDAQGDAQSANEDFQAAMGLEPDARTFASYGAFLLKHEQLDGAFDLLNRALETNPDELSALLNRAIMQRFVNKPGEARADYLHAATVAPNLVPAHLGLGHVALDAGDPEAAAHFTRALALQPDHTEALFGRARARERQGDAAGAAEDRAAAAPGLKREADRLYDLANMRGLVGNAEGAIADYAEVLELNPNDVQALINQGVNYQQLGDGEKALAAWSRAVEVAPTYPNAYVKRGMGLLMAGDSEAGMADLRRALDLAPPDWPSRQAILDVIGGG